MSRAPPPGRLSQLRRLQSLRETRLQAAERDLIAARREVERRAVELAAREAERARIDAERDALQGWFDTALDPRHMSGALARREALQAQRLRAAAAVDEAGAALAAAQGERDEASRRLARARAKLDVASGQVASARRARAARQERDAEQDDGERAAARPRGGGPSSLRGVPA